MIGLPNPYMILGGAGLVLAATTGAFFEGKHVAKGEYAQQKLTALSDALADVKGKQTTINELDAEKTRLEDIRQAAVREIDHETTTVIERPVYRNVCVDADGVSLLDRAQDLASGHPGGSAGPPAGPPVGPAKGPANH